MLGKMMHAVVGMLVVIGFASAEEYDAVINDPSRAFTKRKMAPEKFYYGKLTLDSKGKIVSIIFKEGVITKATKVAMGEFDETKKKWVAGEPIEGGVQANLFKESGKTVQVRITIADDNKTINQILVKKTAEPLVQADPEFDAVLKQVVRQFNGIVAIWYTRIELDDKDGIVKTFALTSGVIPKETKVVMGKYDEKEKKWVAGDPIPNGVFGDIFKDLGAKKVYVRLTFRDDRRGVAQILVRQIGDKK